MDALTDDPEARIVESATCLACGCLCDDIRVVVESGRIVEADHACSIGRPWFLASRPGAGFPPVSIDGQPAELNRAIERAADILRTAQAPLLWGLSGTTVEAVSAALAIADRVGAVVDLAGSAGELARLRAFQRVGQVSATLGEVKDRADVVVFWGVDPLTSHPRHWERYSVGPRGRFVPGGRAGRFVIVVDSEPSETSRAADLFLQYEPNRQAETLAVLRCLARGIALDPGRVDRSTGLSLPILEDLNDRLKRARFGAFFFDSELGRGKAGARTVEAALTLVRDLNHGRRFVAMEMGGPGNGSGASAVLGWQAGANSNVDFGLGYPRHLPGEANLAARLERGEVDVALIIADDPRSILAPEALARLGSISTIVIAPGATGPGRPSAVAFDVARTGIEAGGTVGRSDGVMLPLRPAVSADLPTDREILVAIARRLDVSG